MRWLPRDASVGPVSFVLPKNPVHAVISRSFRPIFARLQLIKIQRGMDRFQAWTRFSFGT